MAQFNITLTEEELHELFLSNSRDKAVVNCKIKCDSKKVEP